jgi:imidazole glycerol-phosphate synthase subunit HisH
MRVSIFDYGAGNIHSLAKAIAAYGATVEVEADPTLAIDTDVLVLPGVGAFGLAAERLGAARGAMQAALRSGLPCLGICLGMQLLFDASDEAPPNAQGLGIFSGRVTRLRAKRVPQIGWNSVDGADDALFTRAPLSYAYYANSYVCRPVDASVVHAWSTHEGDRFAAVVRADRTVGVQFHPEKSSGPGLRFLHAFLDDAKS